MLFWLTNSERIRSFSSGGHLRASASSRACGVALSGVRVCRWELCVRRGHNCGLAGGAVACKPSSTARLSMSRKNNLQRRRNQGDFDRRRAWQPDNCCYNVSASSRVHHFPARSGEEELKQKQEEKRLRKAVNQAARAEQAEPAAAAAPVAPPPQAAASALRPRVAGIAKKRKTLRIKKNGA